MFSTVDIRYSWRHMLLSRLEWTQGYNLLLVFIGIAGCIIHQKYPLCSAQILRTDNFNVNKGKCTQIHGETKIYKIENKYKVD